MLQPRCLTPARTLLKARFIYRPMREGTLEAAEKEGVCVQANSPSCPIPSTSRKRKGEGQEGDLIPRESKPVDRKEASLCDALGNQGPATDPESNAELPARRSAASLTEQGARSLPLGPGLL